MVLGNGVPVNNIRIALTKRCNLSCIFCHGEGEPPGVDNGREITLQDIDDMLCVAEGLGITKVRFTGGEPLMREDITDIVKCASKYMKDISLSTNGILLGPIAQDLKDAGLHRVNITLNTLNPAVYESISGINAHEQVMRGIEGAYNANLLPIKLNMVMLQCNYRELEEMIKFLKGGMVLQLIELISPREHESTNFYKENYVDISPIEKYLETIAISVKERAKHRRKKYFLPQEVEVVHSMHNSSFCQNCTSIRVTSEGFIKKCLFINDNLRKVNNFRDHEELREAMVKSINEKKPYWC